MGSAIGAFAVFAASQRQGAAGWIALSCGFGLGVPLAIRYLIPSMRSTTPVTARGLIVVTLAAGSGPLTGAIARALHAEDLLLLVVTLALGALASSFVLSVLDERAMAATTVRRLRRPRL